uniref:Uncharacterized protein n=1 Tax=Arundo donax TaxID=35708 RepID=A0A0A9C6P4_ARUDO
MRIHTDNWRASRSQPDRTQIKSQPLSSGCSDPGFSSKSDDSDDRSFD